LSGFFLGGLFIVASLDKLADPAAFAASILNYKIVGPTLAMVIATVLPSLELLCGLSLILGLYSRTSALLITFMLIGFTILIISALLRGLDISCGCFTQDPNVSKNRIYKNFRECRNDHAGRIITVRSKLWHSDYSVLSATEKYTER